MTAATELLGSMPAHAHDDAITLEHVLGDLAGFERRVQHQLTYVRDLSGVRLHRLLSVDDIDGLLAGAGLRTPFVSLVDNDQIVPADEYCRQIRIGSTSVPDLVHPGRVLDRVRGGATLILQGLQRYWPPVARLCREVEDRWGYACHANAYLTPPHAQGFAEHADGHDTLLLQTHGEKQWTVAQRPDGEVSPLNEEPGRWTFRLTAPGALYIPAGTRHAGATAEGASLHVTLGMTPWTWERVAQHLADLALGSLKLTGHLPAGALSGRSNVGPELHELTNRIANAFRDLSLETAIRSLRAEFIDKSPPLLTGQLQYALASPPLSDSSLVARRPGTLASVIEQDGNAVLVLGDRRLPMPGPRRAVVQHVLSLTHFRVAELQPFLPADERIELVERLLHEGLLVLTE